MERDEAIKKIRRVVQENLRRERSLHTLLEVETITIKGRVVYDANEPLKGIILNNKM